MTKTALMRTNIFVENFCINFLRM